ncbi:MAG: Fe(2+) transporter permease subunit FeoB [Kistimonas sp.]|nr:Fe(2+) transporter permease subunit FeoB [Kistimonas sp.]
MKTQGTLALVGNPNCGKTTLFNAVTGARQRVGNWAGVTVDKKVGRYAWEEQEIELIDMPGTYSLTPGTEELPLDEQVAQDYILRQDADLYINVIDACAIERNLYLTTQLLEMKKPMLVVLNMMDVARQQGIKIDIKSLSERLGCPVLPVSSSKNQGIKALKAAIADQLKARQPVSHVATHWGQQLESALAQVQPLAQSLAHSRGLDERWLASRLLEGDPKLEQQIENADQLKGIRARLRADCDEDVDILCAEARYNTIDALVQGVVVRRDKLTHSTTEKIDRIVLNRFLALPLFFCVMYLMFMFTTNIGGAFIDFFDLAGGALFVDGSRYLLESWGTPGWLVALIADGLGLGIQTVLTFVPVVSSLFIALAVLEDSGYMARAAFILDRAMQKIGLPGKAFVPILVGFGCTVPAIMATRTLEQDRERKITIMMSPFMSCGARLPIYALFAVIFFPAHGQNVVFLLYLIGILAAVFTGLLMKHTLLPGENTPLVMELPRYHRPTLRGILLRTRDRLKSFVVKAGRTIVLMVTLLGVLNSLGTDGSFGNVDTEKSLLASAGRELSPLFAPMGIEESNWPATVALITGLFAKESVVGTLDSLYSRMGTGEDEDSDPTELNLMASLGEAWDSIPANLALLSQTFLDPLGLTQALEENDTSVAGEKPVHMSTYNVIRHQFASATAAFAYLLFVLLYMPCVSAMGAVKKEAGAGWMWFSGAWTTYLAWVTATGYYQISTFHQHPAESGTLLGLLLASFCFVYWLLNRVAARSKHQPTSTHGSMRPC